MSPASAGTLEVERYIGACLISSQHRSKSGIGGAHSPAARDVYYPRDRYVHQDVYSNPGYQVSVDNRYRPRRCNAADGWAGGMPLISFANNHRRTRRVEISDTRSSSPRVTDDTSIQTPLSRLAVHTQGVPLILSSRQNNRRNKNTTRRDGVITQGRPVDPASKKDNSSRAVDALSIASDESSGSNNSETSLPRIIKPRKRRKKDRKPHAARPPSTDGHQDACQVNSQGVVSLKPYVVPYCYTREHAFPPRYINSYNASESVSDNNRQRVPPVSVIDGELSEAPQLHHKFEDVVGPEIEIEQQQPSSCQCRYCDPAGQIWDVDRHCYSPFLTTPTFRHDHPPFVDPTAVVFSRRHIADKISSALENQCLISTFSLDLETSRDSSSGVSSGEDSPGSVTGRDVTSRSRRTAQCIEISTEIVTSHNGHRDLEIRLFSSRVGSVKVQKDTSGERLSDDCTLQPEE